MDEDKYVRKLKRLNKFIEDKTIDLKLERLGKAHYMIGDHVVVTKYKGERVEGQIKFADVTEDGDIIYIIHKKLKSGKLSKHPIAYSLFQYFFLENDMEFIEANN